LPNVHGQIAKILANASTPDFSGASDIILGYAINAGKRCASAYLGI
jgi:hypothetical protein